MPQWWFKGIFPFKGSWCPFSICVDGGYPWKYCDSLEEAKKFIEYKQAIESEKVVWFSEAQLEHTIPPYTYSKDEHDSA